MSISEGMMLTCDICGTSQFFTESQQSVDDSWMKWQKFLQGPRFIFKKGSALCPDCSYQLNERLRAGVYEIKKQKGLE